MQIALRNQELALLDTLRGVMDRYGQKYCFPSQKTLLALLEKYHSVVICRRTLNNWLRRLETVGFIYRIKRHYREGNGPVKMRSTAYYICNRGEKALVKMRKLIGYVKRLKKFYPSFKVLAPFRVQKSALNTDTPKQWYANDLKSDGPSSEPSHILRGLKLPWRK